MKKATILIVAISLIALPALAEEKVDEGSVILGSTLDCTDAQTGTCGDILLGVVGNQPGGPLEYGCSTLDYDQCDEVVYEICLAADDNLTLVMNYNHVSGETDLDMFLLGSCDEADCIDSATGTSGVETIGPVALTAGTYYVVVDGWTTSGVGRCVDGSHDLAVECSSPCGPVSVEETSWGQIKGSYKE
jgi:hypothetical protein